MKYEKILEEAKNFTPNFRPEEIEELLAKVSKLKKSEKRKVMETIKKSASLPYKEQEAIMKEVAPQQNADQLAIVESMIGNFGVENILSTKAHIWIWNKSEGRWKNTSDIEVRQGIQNYLRQNELEVTSSLVNAITSLLKPHVYKESHEWDANPDIINFHNGELHYENGSWNLKDHCRENYRTTVIPYNWDSKAQCPRFLQFLNEIFSNDADKKEKQTCLLEMIGYSLTNTCKFEKYIILVGEGANGKTVLLELVARIAGLENTCAVQPLEFNNKFQRAHLQGKLVNIVSELKQGGKIPDDAVKAITTGELITAEHKNMPPFSFKPYCTLWFATNHMPNLSDFSHGSSRRPVILQFNERFIPGKNADLDLKAKLQKEIPGIIALCLEAYGRALARGHLTEPPSSLIAKQNWITEQDQVKMFLFEKCAQDPTASVKSNKLYELYKNWCRNQGLKFLTHNDFTKRIQQNGAKTDRGTGGVRLITRLRISDASD